MDDDRDPSASVHLTDPRAMRALAHPTRLRLLGELRTRGPQTVGVLSELVDEAPGTVSYHLGTLAKHGFVADAPELARDRRESWWRAVHRSTSWEPLELLADPERRAAMEVLQRTVLAGYAEQLEGYLHRQSTLPPEWVAAATMSDAVLHLTSDQLGQLRDLIIAGKADPSFIVSQELDLDQAAEGYQHFDARDDGWTKVVLHP